jgi:hypothetical protein
MYLTTGYPTYLYSFEADGKAVVCPLAERSFAESIDIATPVGFSGFTSSGDIPAFRARWREFVQERGYVCGYLALNPLFENPLHYEETYASNSLYFLHLRLGTEFLLRRADRNRRREIRDWRRSGRSFTTDRQALSDFLVAHYPEFLRRVDGSPAAHFTEETLRELCTSSHVCVVGAVTGGEIVAAYAFASTRWVGDCLLNVAIPTGRRFSTALLWWGVEKLAADGVPCLNMGGGARPHDAVAQAKERFRPEVRSFRCLKQVYDREKYEALCRSAVVDPYRDSGYFPPYRSPSLVSSSGHMSGSTE